MQKLIRKGESQYYIVIYNTYMILSGKSSNARGLCSKRRQRSSAAFFEWRESPSGHTHGFSPWRFQRAQPPFILNSWPLFALSLSPLAEALGGYRLPKPPNPHPPRTCHFSPKFRSWGLSVSGARLPGLCDKPGASGDIKSHFREVDTHNFTQQTVCEDVSIGFPLHVPSQLLWPLSHVTSPGYKGLSSPEGKALGRGRSLPSPVWCNCLLPRALPRAPARLKCQYTQLRLPEPPLKPQVSAQNAWSEPCCSLPNCRFPTRMMRVFHTPRGSLDGVRRLSWVEESELFCCFPVKFPSFFLHLQRKKAALDLKALQLKRCKYTIFLSEHKWKQESSVNARDSQKIKQHHGRKSIRTVSCKKGILALRSSDLVQTERVWQGSAAACLPCLILFLKDILNSNVWDAKLMGWKLMVQVWCGPLLKLLQFYP